MEGTGAYAIPTKLPFVAKGPIRTKMSPEAKARLDYLMSTEVELFTDDETGELYSKITDLNTGTSKVWKCEYTDED